MSTANKLLLSSKTLPKLSNNSLSHCQELIISPLRYIPPWAISSRRSCKCLFSRQMIHESSGPPNEAFFSQKPSTCPFIPGHIASLSYASFPRCHPINRVLPREQIATRFGSAAPTHCYQNAMFLEKGRFMLLLFSTKKGWQPDSKMILCVIDFVFFLML